MKNFTLLIIISLTAIFGRSQNYLGISLQEVKAAFQNEKDWNIQSEEYADDGTFYFGYFSNLNPRESRAYYFESNDPNSICVQVKFTYPVDGLEMTIAGLTSAYTKIDNTHFLDLNNSVKYSITIPSDNKYGIFFLTMTNM